MEWGTSRPDGGHPVLGLRVRKTACPRTTSPSGQLVLGPHVWEDSWSGGTAGPGGQLVLQHHEYFEGNLYWLFLLQTQDYLNTDLDE